MRQGVAQGFFAQADPADTSVTASALDAFVTILVDVREIPEKFPVFGGQGLHVGERNDPVHKLLDGLLVVLVLMVLEG